VLSPSVRVGVMVENYYYGYFESEAELRRKLETKTVARTKAPGAEYRINWVIKRRIVLAQSDFPKKAVVLEELEGPGGRKELRLGYYIINRRGRWQWGQFASMIHKHDLERLIEIAKEKGFL